MGANVTDKEFAEAERLVLKELYGKSGAVAAFYIVVAGSVEHGRKNPPQPCDAVAECIREIRGAATDSELIDRLVVVQGFLRHGSAQPRPCEGCKELRAQLEEEKTFRYRLGEKKPHHHGCAQRVGGGWICSEGCLVAPLQVALTKVKQLRAQLKAARAAQAVLTADRDGLWLHLRGDRRQALINLGIANEGTLVRGVISDVHKSLSALAAGKDGAK